MAARRSDPLVTTHRVLVVDDMADIAELLCLQLERLGHTCASADTGHRALAVAESFRPHVVLCDIGLPDLSGYEVARVLRGRPGGSALYLAAITGWAQVEDHAQAIAAGFDRHVAKPTSPTVIREIMIDVAMRRLHARDPRE